MIGCLIERESEIASSKKLLIRTKRTNTYYVALPSCSIGGVAELLPSILFDRSISIAVLEGARGADS